MSRLLCKWYKVCAIGNTLHNMYVRDMRGATCVMRERVGGVMCGICEAEETQIPMTLSAL